jgi:hypothetical protein
MPTPKVEDVINKFIELREKRSEIKKKYEEKDLVLKDAMEKIEVFLSRYLVKEGLQSANIGLYTAYFAKEYKVGCADWPNFWLWMATNNRCDMTEKRVAVGVIKDYLEEKKELPPFVNLTVEKVVRVRRV